MINLKNELQELEERNSKIVGALNRLHPLRQSYLRQEHHDNIQRMNEIRKLIEIYDT